MKILAVIPARGGSKGIPGKNIIPLLGRPLITYMISAAQQSKFINEMVISTDDDDIAKVALENDAKVCKRPPEISGDSARSEDALLHVLQYYDADILAFLQCTAPLTIAEDIDGTINAMLSIDADTALSVTPFHYFLWNKYGEGINHNKKTRLLRQERDPQYLETGSVYLMKVKGFLEHKHRFFGRTALYIVPESRVLEIDEPFDLKLAEYILKERNGDQNNC